MTNQTNLPAREADADILIVGGGLGGVAAALTAVKMGASVILAEESDWLGGQVTAQGVPFDEHPWNETVMLSRTWWEYRARIRDYYLRNLPLTPEARLRVPLNPGGGYVSTLCHEPRVSVAVIDEMLAPYTFGERLRVLRRHALVSANHRGDKVDYVTLLDLETGRELIVKAATVIDATETGTLIAAAGVEHVTGGEGQAETGEPHALAEADPLDQAGTTWCCALAYHPDEDHTIERPQSYEFWRNRQAEQSDLPLFSFTATDHFTHEKKLRPLFATDSDAEYSRDLWHFRRIAWRKNFQPGTYPSDITIACWNMHEYLKRPLLGVTPEEHAIGMAEAHQQTLSMIYWLQTEAPRHDGGVGYKGLRPRGDVLGTADGLAKQPYSREGRRIRAEFTLLEQHIGVEARKGLGGAAFFKDSVGLAAYRINIHPSTRGRDSIDIPSYPYQIPLGTMLPVRVDNLLPACCKLVGSTRLTTSSLRHHPIDWVIGEAAGALAAYAHQKKVIPRAVRADTGMLADYQRHLSNLGLMLRWPQALSMDLTYAQGGTFSEIFWRTQGAGRFDEV